MAANAMIGWLNRVDAGTLSAGSADSQRPVTNLATVQPTEKWRTAGLTSTYFDLDNGSAMTMRAVALMATNLTSTATIRVQLSDVAAGGTDIADSGTVSAGVLANTESLIDPPKNALYVFSAAQTARYARVTLADAALSGTGYIEVGRAFIGPVWQPTRNFELAAPFAFDDSTREQESDGGQEFLEEGTMRRIVELRFRNLTEADAWGNAWPLQGAVGRRKDVLLIPYPDSAYLAKQWIWGRLRALTPIAAPTYGRYETRFEVRERK